MNSQASIDKVSRTDRALGAYLGLAVGDALGGTVEFMSPASIRARYGIHQEMIGGGWLDLRPGQVTDDTEMSIILGRVLISHRGWSVHAAADGFVAWLRSGPIDIGATVQRGLQRYMIEGSVAGEVRVRDAGNGAAMRNLPVVLATLDDDTAFEAWTLSQCHITHNNPLSDAATLALGRMVRRMVMGEGITAAAEEAKSLVATDPVFTYEPFPGKSSAYIVDTLQTVLSCFFGAGGFRNCLIRTVNQGGDADTTGALAGMLAGAAYGLGDIPTDWLEKLDPKVASEIRSQVPRLLNLRR